MNMVLSLSRMSLLKSLLQIHYKFSEPIKKIATKLCKLLVLKCNLIVSEYVSDYFCISIGYL